MAGIVAAKSIPAISVLVLDNRWVWPILAYFGLLCPLVDI